jgi:hypothetical protein
MTEANEERIVRERAEAIVAEALAHMREVDDILGPELHARILARFDDFHQRRRQRLSLQSFAEAFGWQALARPRAAAGLLGALCAIGFFAGAALGDEGDVELAAALDQSFGAATESVQ